MSDRPLLNVVSDAPPVEAGRLARWQRAVFDRNGIGTHGAVGSLRQPPNTPEVPQ